MVSSRQYLSCAVLSLSCLRSFTNYSLLKCMFVVEKGCVQFKGTEPPIRKLEENRVGSSCRQSTQLLTGVWISSEATPDCHFRLLRGISRKTSRDSVVHTQQLRVLTVPESVKCASFVESTV